MNTWVNFTYAVPEKKVVSTVCSVEGCGKPRSAMNERHLRKMCKEHHAEWMKEYHSNRKLLKK